MSKEGNKKERLLLGGKTERTLRGEVSGFQESSAFFWSWILVYDLHVKLGILFALLFLWRIDAECAEYLYFQHCFFF